ncbi:MAG TPA: DinB family protein [Holophagaceae bacterium]|nr:DinB family protein [Holophagaceae bacterium]
MFRHIRDFKTLFREERDQTLAVLAAIPDAAAHQAVDAHHRDLKRLAWHLAESVVEMPEHMGLKVEGFPGECSKTPPPATMAEIAQVYRTVTDSLLAAVEPLNDMALAATYPFYGQTWTGATALTLLVAHQTHHRGQMTVLMRQAGLKPPSIYGPVQEDWKQMGMEAPAV